MKLLRNQGTVTRSHVVRTPSLGEEELRRKTIVLASCRCIVLPLYCLAAVLCVCEGGNPFGLVVVKSHISSRPYHLSLTLATWET